MIIINTPLGRLMRQIAPLTLSLIALWVLREKIIALDLDAIWALALQFAPSHWVVASLLAAASFTAISQYDRLVAGQIGFKIDPRSATRAGWRATAIAQALGFGVIAGALVRWRLLSGDKDVSLWRASQLTLCVTISFLFGLTCIAALFNALNSTMPFEWRAASIAVCLIIATAFIVTIAPPEKFAKWLPTTRFSVSIVILTLIDTLAACAVIYVFLPVGYMPFLTLYSAFLIAYGVGMVSGTPGGVGPFELCMLSLLNLGDPVPLLAAILAFRVAYYVFPALLAAPSLIQPLKQMAHRPMLGKERGRIPSSLQIHAPAEATLLCQSQLAVQTDRTHELAALFHRAQNTDIALGNLFGHGDKAAFLNDLSARALEAGRALCIYKCDKTLAGIAKKQGFLSFQIGSEAIVRTSEFDISTKSFRQLRRKIRKAEKAGIKIARAMPDYAALERVDAEWQSKRGRARGFSMGVLSQNLVAQQHVFTAHLDGVLVAYISFSTTPHAWSLDLVRYVENCPDGTLHALVNRAIDAAKAECVARVSLSTVPFFLKEGASNLIERLLCRYFRRCRELNGLLQFKQCFAPQYSSQYLAVSRISSLPLAAIDIWKAIHQRTRPQHAARDIHNHYDVYEFDSRARACNAHG